MASVQFRPCLSYACFKSLLFSIFNQSIVFGCTFQREYNLFDIFSVFVGALVRHWGSVRAEAQVEAGSGMATEAPWGLPQAGHQATQRSPNVWTPGLLQNHDRKGPGQRKWHQLHCYKGVCFQVMTCPSLLYILVMYNLRYCTSISLCDSLVQDATCTTEVGARIRISSCKDLVYMSF